MCRAAGLRGDKPNQHSIFLIGVGVPSCTRLSLHSQAVVKNASLGRTIDFEQFLVPYRSDLNQGISTNVLAGLWPRLESVRSLPFEVPGMRARQDVAAFEERLPHTMKKEGGFVVYWKGSRKPSDFLPLTLDITWRKVEDQ